MTFMVNKGKGQQDGSACKDTCPKTDDLSLISESFYVMEAESQLTKVVLWLHMWRGIYIPYM